MQPLFVLIFILSLQQKISLIPLPDCFITLSKIPTTQYIKTIPFANIPLSDFGENKRKLTVISTKKIYLAYFPYILSNGKRFRIERDKVISSVYSILSPMETPLAMAETLTFISLTNLLI